MTSTQELYLRSAHENDLHAIKECFTRSEGIHLPWVYPPRDYTDYLSDPGRYFLCLTNTHTIVGSFGLANIVRGYFQSAYLGYEVYSPFNGRGYMKQGMAMMIELAFDKLKLHRLEANVQPDNSRSIKLLQNAGFTKEGYSKDYLNVGGRGWRDHERWALLNIES